MQLIKNSTKNGSENKFTLRHYFVGGCPSSLHPCSYSCSKHNFKTSQLISLQHVQILGRAGETSTQQEKSHSAALRTASKQETTLGHFCGHSQIHHWSQC